MKIKDGFKIFVMKTIFLQIFLAHAREDPDFPYSYKF